MTTEQKHRKLPEKPPRLVESTEALKHLVDRLMQEPQVAVDTESNSLYAYHEQVCLIQFTIPEADFILDPFAVEDLSALAPFFADREIEKVLHAADYDLIVLERDYGFTCGRLFDTMWAGRILGWPHVGLGSMLEEHFGIHLNKKFQRYDWGRRPLEPKAIAYARMDTHYLLDLREIQLSELKARDRWEEAQEVFEYLRTNVPEPPSREVDATFWRLKGLHKLKSRERRALYQLHRWREATAEAMERPPFKVMSRKRLIELARTQPRHRQGLKDAGLSNYQIRRFGREILKIFRSKWEPLPPAPKDEGRPPDAVMERYHALHDWRKDVAAGRGVDSDVILPNATLWHLVWHPPENKKDLLDVPGIG
ncbi:MAG: ribonuclease D, partial [Anaerolineae bacterium]